MLGDEAAASAVGVIVVPAADDDDASLAESSQKSRAIAKWVCVYVTVLLFCTCIYSWLPSWAWRPTEGARDGIDGQDTQRDTQGSREVTSHST